MVVRWNFCQLDAMNPAFLTQAREWATAPFPRAHEIGSGHRARAHTHTSLCDDGTATAHRTSTHSVLNSILHIARDARALDALAYSITNTHTHANQHTSSLCSSGIARRAISGYMFRVGWLDGRMVCYLFCSSSHITFRSFGPAARAHALVSSVCLCLTHS